ncbi:MAG: tripartite tricarboxylate transporter permease [Devosia sp.]
MIILDSLVSAIDQAATLTNLLFIVAGVALGIFAGILPGVGTVTALSVLIPITFYFPPLSAIAFLVGVMKGGTSGGAIPAILINAPGTPEAAASALDGYPMARRGEAGRAMKIALYSSVSGDTISDVILILVAAPFAAFALNFGPAEFTAAILFSFALLSGIASGSLVKGLIATFLGVLLSTIGLDPVDSSPRMVFGEVELFDGLPVLAVAVGSLAVASVLDQLFDLGAARRRSEAPVEPTFDKETNRVGLGAFFSHWRTIIRSALIGSGVGMLPGLGVTLAAFLGYGAARRASKAPESFGTGNPDGIVATEAANSAVSGANLIPTFALGIPGNIAAALLIGAFMIHGVVPGPLMMQLHADLIYAVFVSMLMANVVHLVIGRIGIPIWVMAARAPRAAVLPVVLVLAAAGVYLPAQSLFQVAVMLAFAVLGLFMRRTGFSIVCMVIGFLLGPLLETSLRQSMLIYKSDLTILVRSPIALFFIALTVLTLALAVRRALRDSRQSRKEGV